MCKSLKIALFAALAVLVFSVPAQSAREAGLNGNQLIEDYNDVFTFPQRAGNALNTNRVRVNHAGANATNATIGVKKGDGGWGVGIHATGQPQDPTTVGAAATALEVVYSGGDWGLALALGMGEFKTDGEGNSAMNIGVIAGYTIKGIGETGLSVQMANSEDGAGNKNSAMNIGVNLRGYKKQQAKVDLGYTLNVAFGTVKAEPAMGDAVEGSSLNIEAGAGPRYKVGKGVVALHATLGFSSSKQGDDNELSSIAIPGMNLAFETPLNDWIDFRAGAGYKFVMTTSKQGDVEVTVTHADGGLGMAGFEPAPTGSMGLSAHWGNLNFDAALNRDFLNNGPFLMTGTQIVGWASNISATYKW
jgi:hypothetical protein